MRASQSDRRSAAARIALVLLTAWLGLAGGLRQVGLEADARSLAVEAALAAGL